MSPTSCQGVKRFDGQNWTTYTTSNGLGDNRINALYVTHSGDVWVSHTSSPTARLSRFSGGIWKIFSYSDVPGDAVNQISAITDDTSNNVWIAAGNTVFRFDEITWKSFNPVNNPLLDIWISGIASDGQGRVWLSYIQVPATSSVGLSSFDGSVWKIYTPGNGLPASITSLSSMYGDSHGRVWFTYHTDPGYISYLGFIENGVMHSFKSGDAGYPNFPPGLGFTNHPDGTVWMTNCFPGGSTCGAEVIIYDGKRFTTRYSTATYPFAFDLKGSLFMAGYSNTNAKVLWGGTDYTFDPGLWLSSTSYQASYYFNSLIPPGAYKIAANGAYGTDAMEAYSGDITLFNVDYAGQVSEFDAALCSPGQGRW